MKPISSTRMCRALEERGWRLDRVRGGHYIHPDGGRRVTVPVHGNTDLKPGTQGTIMRDAGLTDADL